MESEDDFWGGVRAAIITGHFDDASPLPDSPGPVDIWARNEPPPLPVGLLPPIIERFAHIRSELVGADPGGFAMAALTICASAITDRICLRMKRNEEWTESARIWTMLVGDPSYKKSPIMKAAARKISKMDGEMLRQYNRDIQKWYDTGEQGDMPVPTRLRIEDITMEAAQEVCQHSPDGVLALQDELAGWFGGIEKYSGGKGSAKDRGFWLRAFNGGEYAVNRISRKSILIDNLSISILGGIQPDAIRKIMSDATDDGLVQRFFPIVLMPSRIGKDEEMPESAYEYDTLVERLHHLKPVAGFLGDMELRFSDEAQRIRNTLEKKHHEMSTSMERINRKLASHLGKLDGLFGRLCVLFHCIETVASERTLDEIISENTASRVSQFIHGYLVRHAMSFYGGVLGMSDDQGSLEDVAGYILAHKVESVTMRTLQRGSRTMRKLTRQEGARIFEQLEAFGWLEQLNLRSDAPSWRVDEQVHDIFEQKAKAERARRRDEMAVVKAMIEGEDVGVLH